MSKSPYKVIQFFLTKLYKGHKNGKSEQRISVLAHMISSCILNKSSRLESISADFPEKINKESKIKKTQRFLSSKWNDYEDYYLPFIEDFLQGIGKQESELIFIIDGTQTAGDCVTLMISVLWRNHAVPVIWSMKKGEKGHFSQKKHIELVQRLCEIIPQGKRKIFLGDGEFDGTKLIEELEDNDFEYVLRTSKDRKIENEFGEKDSFENHTNSFENIKVLFEYACGNTNAVYWKDKKYEDPIYLLSNMEVAGKACFYYKKRFKIELLFKQLKSAGFHLNQSKLQGEKRCSNLVMILAFAFMITFSLGVFIKEQPKEFINKIYRYDRIDTIKPITLAQKCIDDDWKFTLNFFRKWADNYACIFVYG